MKYYDLGYPVDPMKTNLTQNFGKAKNDWLQHQYETVLGIDGHNGQDWGTYNKPIMAMHDGIAEVYETKTGGKSIRVWDRETQKIMTFYCHLNDWLVKNGQKVEKGEDIGISGNTGTMCFGGHLHAGLYELTRSGKYIKNYNNGYKGAINPAPHQAIKFNENDLIKHQYEDKVFIIKNQKKFWLNSPESFEDFIGMPVSSAKINIVDSITHNFYEYGGQIGRRLI